MSLRLYGPASEEDWGSAEQLVREYISNLGVDLSFQDLERELRYFREIYVRPTGAFLLATVNGAIAGCVGVRQLEADTAELKRLYVRSFARRQGVGGALVAAIIQAVRTLGYRRIVLDTLPSMKGARELYRRAGFRSTNPYCFNPIPGAEFLELLL